MRSPFISRIAALVFLAPAPSAFAALPAWPDIVEVRHYSVLRWNVNSATPVYSHNTPSEQFGELQRLNDGRFVAYRANSGGFQPALVEINPETGARSLLVQSAAAARRVQAFAPLSDGNLFGWDVDEDFVVINPATLGFSTRTIQFADPIHVSACGAMARSPDGEIYAWLMGLREPGNIFTALFKLDPVAGTGQEIGGFSNLPFGASLSAMSFAPDGALVGFTDTNADNGGGPWSANGIYDINLLTGMPTLLAQRSHLDFVAGAAFVPEPTAPLLAGLISALILRRAGRH